MTQSRRYGLLLAPILLATTLVYANSLHNPFIVDDRIIIFDNFYPGRSWRAKDLFRHGLFGKEPSQSPYFRPLTLLTFALNYPFSGEHPEGYRAVNVALHLIVVSLTFLLLSSLTEGWVAGFAALLFALHPVHVQAVSYISSRSDPLYTALALTCLLLWYKGSRTSGYGRSVCRSLGLIAYFLGLFAKETMVVVPALAILMDLTWDRPASWRDTLRGNLGWYLGFLLFFSIYLLIRLEAGFSLTMEGGRELDLWSRVLLALKLFGLYVSVSFYPLHLFLFRTVSVPQTLSEWQVIQGMMLLAGLVTLAGLFWSMRKEVSFGIAWFLISILPTLNLTLLNAPMMEHWLYLPLIGLSLALVGGLRTLAERVGEVRGIGLGIISLALLLSARTVTRNAEWSNLERFFLHEVSSHPRYFKTWQWLADTEMRARKWDDAIVAYRSSLRLNPGRVSSWLGLAEASWMVGKDMQAGVALDRALSLRPRSPQVHYRRGIYYLKIGKNRQAIKSLEQSITLNPSPRAYHALGSAYLRLGQQEKAEEAFQKALLMRPGGNKIHARIHIYLGNLYMARRRRHLALEEWRLALRFAPESTEAKELLGQNPGR